MRDRHRGNVTHDRGPADGYRVIYTQRL